MAEDAEWFDDYVDETEETQVEEYDITAALNDFNVLMIFSFLESGSVRIPWLSAQLRMGLGSRF